MAQIVTENSRPQFATVRYKVMEQSECVQNPQEIIIKCNMGMSGLSSKIRVLNVKKKEKETGIRS